MTGQEDQRTESTDTNTTDSVTRRRLLKGVGAGSAIVIGTAAGSSVVSAGHRPHDIEWCLCDEVRATGFKKKEVDEIKALQVITYDGVSLTFTEVELTDDVSPVEADPLEYGELGFAYENTTDTIVGFRVKRYDEKFWYYLNLDPSGCADRGLRELLRQERVIEGVPYGKEYYVCEEPPEPPEDCLVCGDGEADKVSEITFTFTGDDGSRVQFYDDKEAKTDKLVFDQVLNGGNTFTVTPPSGESEFHNDVSVYVDGVKAAEFHVSCSRPFGPGLIKGDFEVFAGKDKNGNPLCPVGCAECGDGDADKVSQFDFEYTGDVPATVTVYNDKEASDDKVAGTFEAAGDTRTFTVTPPSGESEFKSDISVYVDGEKNAQFHTSCSQPFGPGISKGDIAIVGGRDKNGVELCDIGCAECGIGEDDADGVSQLTISDSDGRVTVYNDKEAKADALIGTFDSSPFTITPPNGEEKFKSDISFYVDGTQVAKLHTSCSQPLTVGMAFGDGDRFTIEGGRDKAGRPLCE